MVIEKYHRELLGRLPTDDPRRRSFQRVSNGETPHHHPKVQATADTSVGIIGAGELIVCFAVVSAPHECLQDRAAFIQP